ncbi:hypothetical protein LY78DRAFT_90232 [Colletotrichum sublineola]|nr:hypothetical protein LY78DRAFT_90232 [Colletotrichum sublineola]
MLFWRSWTLAPPLFVSVRATSDVPTPTGLDIRSVSGAPQLQSSVQCQRIFPSRSRLAILTEDPKSLFPLSQEGSQCSGNNAWPMLSVLVKLYLDTDGVRVFSRRQFGIWPYFTIFGSFATGATTSPNAALTLPFTSLNYFSAFKNTFRTLNLTQLTLTTSPNLYLLRFSLSFLLY